MLKDETLIYMNFVEQQEDLDVSRSFNKKRKTGIC